MPRVRTLLSCLLLTIVPGLSGCDFVSERVFTYMMEPGPPDAPDGVVAHRDIVFNERAGRQLQLDLYVPETASVEPTPVVLFLFGGGWERGNRHQMIRFGLLDYPQRGIAVATADYSYIHEAIFPAQIEDVEAAIRWVRDNAAAFNLDDDRIGVIGPSAGGHLAALAGTANRPGERDVATAQGVRTDVQAVVNFYGPTDFSQGDAHRLPDADPWNAPDSRPSRLLGAPIDEVPGRVAAANPITYVDGSEPPFLIIHGEKDALVPLHQSQILQQALEAAGVESELLVIEGGDHGFGGDFYSSLPMDRMDAFFELHLKGEG